MATAVPDADDDIHLGRIANNHLKVTMIQSLLSKSNTNMETLPGLFKRIATEECWREFLLPDGEIVRWKAADFRKFIETPRPKGCQTPCYILERSLRGTDAWEIYLELTRGEPGNPTGNNQHSSGKCDNVTLSTPEPTILSLPNKPPTGNSVSYSLRFLSKKAPELYARVKAGELSANKAMVLGGFRVKQITLPAEPEAAARVLRRHFKGDDLARLISKLQDDDPSH